MVNEEKEKGAYTDWFEGAYYRYVYIGEEYITVEMYQRGWSGGIRGWNLEEPVTFERKSCSAGNVLQRNAGGSSGRSDGVCL